MIAVFLPNGIGDILMLIPALRRLIDIKGVEKIMVVVQGGVHREILCQLLGRELLIIQRIDGRPFPNLRLWTRLFSSPLEIILAPLLSRRPLHLLYFLTLFKSVLAPSLFITKKFMRLMPASINLENFDGHQVNYYVKFFAEYDSKIRQDLVKFDEYSCIQRIVGADLDICRPRRIVVGISCGDKERHKIPSPLFFASFLNALAESSPIEVLVIGSSSDIDKINTLCSQLSPKVFHEVLIEMPLEVLLKRIASCDLGVSGTTGQGHIMALAQLPMLIFSGVTNPFQSGPYVPQGAILRHAYLCGPCYQEKFRFGCGSINCMETLDINEAVELANKLLTIPGFGRDWLLNFPEVQTKSIVFIKSFLRTQLGKQ